MRQGVRLAVLFAHQARELLHRVHREGPRLGHRREQGGRFLDPALEGEGEGEQHPVIDVARIGMGTAERRNVGEAGVLDRVVGGAEVGHPIAAGHLDGVSLQRRAHFRLAPA